jgi:hypothetical protein
MTQFAQEHRREQKQRSHDGQGPIRGTAKPGIDRREKALEANDHAISASANNYV